jgi:isopenicillin N synthase-like dioxygenase
MVNHPDTGGAHLDSAIPFVDLGDFIDGTAESRRRIAAEVDEICRSIGFLVIENHGVPPAVIEEAWMMAKAFFDLPLEQKLSVRARDAGCPRGYFPLEAETLAKTRGTRTLPDRKECFSSGPLSPPPGHAPDENFDFFYGPNLWPTEPGGFHDAWVCYYREMEALGARIMEMLALALNLDSDYFSGFHAHHLSALRALNYPQRGAAETIGQPRAGAHSDYGSVTILKPDPQVGGLEVRLPNGAWTTAPVVDDAFIVNIGDLMARWTNDRWISTLHRVTDPASDGVVPRRQSIAYFMNPNYDAEIATIPTCLDGDGRSAYPTVAAGEYLIGKFASGIADAG